MPWSPIPKFPEIIEYLKDKGYKKEVSLSELRKAVMLKTGVIRDQTIKTIIITMEELEFIKNRGNSIFLIEPLKWKKDQLKEEEKELDKKIDMLIEKNDKGE